MSVDEMKDMDVASLYPNILPVVGRGCGKSAYQMALYEYFLKESNDMSISENIDLSKVEIKKAPEEWIWITGYKGTDKDMCCKSYQYELSRQFNIDDNEHVAVCQNGFHLCRDLKNVFTYYDVSNGNRFFEVAALVRKRDVEMGGSLNRDHFAYGTRRPEDKFVAKSIIFTRELNAEEVFASLDPDACSDWTIEDKEEAMRTSIRKVRSKFNIRKLTALGYSEPFATYLANKGYFNVAYAVGSQPGLSMDMKCLAIFANDD